MTTITLESPTLTGKLEELVDRLLAALFREEPEQADAQPSLARTVHEARRLRQSGGLDGALAVLAGVDLADATEAQLRWLYADWLDLARRRFADGGAVLYSPATGRAAVLVPENENGGTLTVAAVLGMRWPPGKPVSRRSLRGLAPGKRGCGMVAANATVDLQELKARHPLGDTVEAAGVVLRGKGRVRQGVCPFHQEAEGSFTVYADSEKFYCFGCGAGGDVLDFVQRTEGLTLPEAIRRLDDRVEPVVPAPSPVASGKPAPATVLPPRDPALLTAAARFYAGELRRSPKARAYLAARGIDAGAVMELGLGYAPGHGLREALTAAGFGSKRLRDSGLFLEHGTERFAGMITVPDLAHGRVRWLTGRAVDAQAKPRFQAVPGPKPVLGLARLGPAPPFAILTEGVFDYLTLTAWGYPACAALGTQGVDKVAANLRGCPRIFLAFDNDGAGREATANLQLLLGRRAAVVNLPQGIADVGELTTLPNGKLIFRLLLARAAKSAR